MVKLPKFLRRRTADERTGSMTVIEHLEELRHRHRGERRCHRRRRRGADGSSTPCSFISFRTRSASYVNGLPQKRSTAGRMPLRGGQRARPDAQQAEGRALPGPVPRAAGGAVPAVGVHRAGPDPAREEDVGAVHRLLDAPVRAGRLRRDGDAAQGPRLPAGLRGAADHAADQLHAATWGSSSCSRSCSGCRSSSRSCWSSSTIVGVLSSAKLRAWRRWSILGIAFFAAVVTPSSDPVHDAVR